jgi:hypothetical protein
MSEEMPRNNCFGQGLWLCLSIAALASLARRDGMHFASARESTRQDRWQCNRHKPEKMRIQALLAISIVAWWPGRWPKALRQLKCHLTICPLRRRSSMETNGGLVRPTGSAASQGHRHWQPGSRHRLRVRPCNSAGDCKPETIDVTFTVQENRDVNGDGFADLAVGTGAEGKAYIFESPGGARGVASANDDTMRKDDL